VLLNVTPTLSEIYAIAQNPAQVQDSNCLIVLISLLNTECKVESVRRDLLFLFDLSVFVHEKVR